MGDLSKNFSLVELICKCGKCQPIVNENFIVRLQKLRDKLGYPLIINSWFRCPEYNKRVGGQTRSMHLLGRAVDLEMTNPVVRAKLVELASQLGFNGIGIYHDFIHIDDRDSDKCLWVGRQNVAK